MDKKNGGDNKSFKSEKPELSFNEILKPMTNDDDFSEMGLLGQVKKVDFNCNFFIIFIHYRQMSSKSKIDPLDKPSLPDFAKHVVRQICLQDWVHDRCLRGFTVGPELVNKLFFDKRLSQKDAQHLLNMICNHKQIVSGSYVSEMCDTKQIISRVFNTLDEWSIRHSWLQLHLISEQLSASSQSLISSEVSSWLDTLARAVVEYFQATSQIEPILDSKQLTLFTSKSLTKSAINNGLNFGNGSNQHSGERIWLVASLISKLPSQLQGKILRVAASIFDSSHWIIQAQTNAMNSKNKSSFQGSKNSNSANGVTMNTQNATTALLSYQPFISLILMCVGLKEDYKDAITSILNSIYLQIGQCIQEKLSDDIRVKHAVQDGLQLRLSLVGAMFEVIQSSGSLTSDWSILLMQLITYDIVDPHINYENFTTVLDMLTALMHTTQVSVAPEQREESKKQHQNLIKKLKKEINVERVGLGVRMARQLLPIIKIQTEVIACEPMGSLVDTKGNKIAGFDSIDKKQGLQVSEKHKLSPWDLLEGHKNPAPLAWTWFGALRIERKPMRMEENFCLLARHNHSIRKPTSFYLEAPPLPPEEDPVPTPQPQPIPSQAPMQAMPFANPGMVSVNGSNMSVQGTPHLANLPHQSGPFNSGNMVHSLQAQSNQHAMASNFHSPHMHHMPGMPTNSLPHGMPQGLSGSMHGGNIPGQQTGQPQSHMMPGNDGHPMGQPGHHMMMNMHTNSMMPMSSMPLDNRDIMDSLTSGNANPMHGGAPMQPGALGAMRPNLNAGQPPAMNPVGVTVPARATTPKATKPKAPRRRRQNAKNQPANTTPPTVAGQQTPPIRMGNSFDNSFSQVPVNNQMAQPVVGQPSNWSYQQQVANQQAPPQVNMPGQPATNAANQSFYQQAGPPGPTMMPPQAQQARFAEAPHPMQNNNSKVRLRAMLNTRHPNTTQFNNMGPSAPAGPANPVNNNQMMNNGNMMPNAMYQNRPQMQMMQQRPQGLRPQVPVAQTNQSMAPMANQNAMFQQQTNNGPMIHHMQQQPQSNFSGAPQSMNFNANTIQNMDQSGMQQMGGNGPGFQAQQPPQPGMMMRPQMPQQPTNQSQFMQQR